LSTSTHPLAPAAAPRTASLRFVRISTSVWGRTLLPSFSDCFFLAILAWLFLAGPHGWTALLGDGDAGWHIRAGEYILDHRSVPTTDLFSFSKAGAPWFAWEWLSDAVFATLHRAAGLKGIVLFSGVLIAAYSTLLLRFALWRGANPLIAALVTLLAVGASSLHFLARPHLFTLLFLPASVWLLERDRGEQTRWVWLLVPLTAVWTNLHGGFAMLLAMVALLACGCAVEALFAGRSWSRVWRYASLFAACSAASLVNPYGTGLHAHILSYLRSDWIRNLIQEFQAPTFRSENQLQFEALLIAGLIVVGFLIRAKRFTEVLWVVFLAHSSLTSARHAPLYAAIAGPIIAAELTAWWRKTVALAPKSSLSRILYQMGEDLAPSFRRMTPWPLVGVLALVFLNEPVKWPHDFPAQLFPVAMVRDNAALLSSGRVLTTDQWGDYFIYHFYPRQKVFIDGRSDFYGESLGRPYLHLMQASFDWRSIMNRWNFRAALLPVDWPLSTLLKQDRAWKVVQDDGRSILFVRIGAQ
jgi:hypothetical protein